MARPVTVPPTCMLSSVWELERVIEAVCKVGISPALESRLRALEDRQRTIRGAISDAETVVVLPTNMEIAAEWRMRVESIGELPTKLEDASEIETARASILDYL